MHFFLIALTVASSTLLGNTLYDIYKLKRSVKQVSSYRLPNLPLYSDEDLRKVADIMVG